HVGLAVQGGDVIDIDREDVVQRRRQAREEARARRMELVACEREHRVVQPVVGEAVGARLGAQVGQQVHQPAPSAFFLRVGLGTTGPPASFHASKPPPMCDTRAMPMSISTRVASAERQPAAQNSTYSLSCANSSRWYGDSGSTQNSSMPRGAWIAP